MKKNPAHPSPGQVALLVAAGAAMLVAALVLLSGCDPVERHRMLTFFFDGVPPLDGEQAEPVGGISRAGTPLGGAQGDVAPAEPTWYIHEPRSQCNNCHGQSRQRGFTRETGLKMPVPQLCYECHDDEREAPGWVHGPVAVGACLVCHDPHRSTNRHILKQPVPQVCYQCHGEQEMQAIPQHRTELLPNCLDCHAGHRSPERGLLRSDFVATAGSEGSG